MADIDSKVSTLSSEQREQFEKNLQAVLESTTWLVNRGFDKVHFDLAEVRQKLYGEMYEHDTSHF